MAGPLPLPGWCSPLHPATCLLHQDLIPEQAAGLGGLVKAGAKVGGRGWEERSVAWGRGTCILDGGGAGGGGGGFAPCCDTLPCTESAPAPQAFLPFPFGGIMSVFKKKKM